MESLTHRTNFILAGLFAFCVTQCFAQSNAPTPNLGAALSQGLAAARQAGTATETPSALVTITGIVKGAAFNSEEAASVQAKKGTYKIVKDAKGNVVARNAVGKKVEIKGTLTEHGGSQWLTVTWCALVE